MADLRINTNVNVGDLAKLAEASKEVASSTASVGKQFVETGNAAADLAARFVASGMSAKDAEGALIGLGYSAKQAAASMAALAGTTQVLGNEAAVTTGKIDAFTRQLANSAVRIAASELGMGQLGFAFGRLGAMSATLAPILASTFTVFAIIAFVQMVEQAVVAYEKWIHLGEETVHKIDDQTLSLVHEGDQLDVVNARLQNQIDKLEQRPENYMALFLAENRVRADQLSKSLEDVLQKELAILKAGPGLGSEIFLGKGNVAGIGRELEPLERELQLANLTNDKVAQQNILIREQVILTRALEEEKAKHVEKVPGAHGTQVTVGTGPDQDALNTYTSMLKGVQQELDNIAKVGKGGELEQQLANLKTAHDREVAAKKYQELVDKNIENARRGQRMEREAVERGIKEQEKAEREAQAALDKIQKKNAEESKRDAKQAEEAWQRTAELRIQNEEEVFRVSQRSSENKMRDIKAQESIAAAGLNKGPVTSVMESTSLQQQSAVAAAAMADAQAAAADYASQLEIVQSVMSEVNQDSEEGARQFKDLEKQMQQLQHQMDSAAGAADRWKTILKQIAAAQAQNARDMGFSMQNIKVAMENAAQSGFQAFNSSFIQMLHGARSFTQVLQGLWTGMVESFVNAILRMAEYYVMKYVVMIAISKIFGETAAETATTDIGLKEVGRQAAIGDAAATAAISAAWAGPAAAITAAATVEAALQGITAFERGGIVRANLHEGEMVLPAHLSTFVQTAAGAMSGVGGPGGPGGRGGPGGPGGAGRGTAQINLTMHNHGDPMSSGDVETAVRRALRRSGYS